MLLEKAYNGGDQVYDESFRGALRSDVDRIALSQAAQIISPSPDEISKLTQQISAIADRTRIIEERLSAIRTR
jgi:hypothetical protein